MCADPIDVDVHPIPARPGEPAHDHLDVRYVAVAPPGVRAVRSEESRELRWFERSALAGLGLDASLARLVDVGWEAAGHHALPSAEGPGS
jgi:hypothetical protein